MRLQFSIMICLSFFTTGWYVVTKGVSLSQRWHLLGSFLCCISLDTRAHVVWLRHIIKALQIIGLLLQACLLEIYLFCKIWSEAYKKTNLSHQSTTKPLENGNVTLSDVFSLWDCKRNVVDRFIEQANTFQPTIKFTAEILGNEI